MKSTLAIFGMNSSIFNLFRSYFYRRSPLFLSFLLSSTAFLSSSCHHYSPPDSSSILSPEAKKSLFPFHYAEPHMGMIYRLIIYHESQELADNAASALFNRIDELNSVMSDYTDESELSHFMNSPAGTPVPLSDDLFEVLSLAQKLAKDSNGAFDATIGNLTQLWRKTRKTGILPTKEELLHAQSLSGWEHLTLDVKHQTGTLNCSGIRLDLGGIGKGFAADKAIELLRQHGVKNAFIAASGDIRVIGAPPGEPGWKIQIETFSQSPEEVGNYIIYLTDAAISTSGDVNQFVEIEGKRYSHIIDIETGLGLTRRSGATVIHSQAAYCDALATLACILEPEEAIQFLKKHNAKLRLIYIDSDNKKQILTTSNFPVALSD